MASSCDDDFALLGDDTHPHPQLLSSAAQCYVPKPSVPVRVHAHPLTTISSPKKGVGGGGCGGRGEGEDRGNDGEGYREAFVRTDASKWPVPAFHDHHHCFPGDDPAANPFAPPPTEAVEEEEEEDQDQDQDDNGNGGKSASHQRQQQPQPFPGKRGDRDELSDGGSPYCLNSNSGGAKRARSLAAVSSAGDHRKDREEWSDSAIGCLLDAYTDKYVQLNRGNLRGRDWEDVATVVTERCDQHKSGKTVEQCKNKIDNLKKRYKAECQRLSSGALSVSHWPWFKQMELIISSSPSSQPASATDDDRPVMLGTSAAGGMRQAKRYSVTTPGPVSITNNSKMKSLSNPRWKRVVLKISGAELAGNGLQNVDPKVTMLIAREIAMANHMGVEVAIVVGGRNFFCGDTWVGATGIDRATACQIGMMASVMNSILLQASLEKIGVQTRVQTAFMMQEIAEPYVKRRAMRHLEKGRVLIFGGIGTGTGSPLFSTDRAATLRASELSADAFLKGTSVDGVYDCSTRNSNSVAFEHISFRELVSRGFTAMDMAAITFCEENNIPIVLFNLLEPGNISRALCGDQVGTLIDQSGRIS